jgi:thioesterase domain-containing protein/acyl carrier protein
MLEHRNVGRLFAATDAWFGFGEEDTWTMFHSYGFDFSVWEIWGALCYGGKLVIVPYMVSRSPELFHALLVDHKVTVLNQTPSAFQQLIDADANANPAFKLQLKTVIFGGEALNRAALQPWFTKHGDTQPQLVNMYGITETTVHVTYQVLNAEQNISANAIGRAIPDLGVYILDPALNLVPIGVAGELHVTGAGLARGYLNRPELTAERFIANPYSSGANSRLYKSGDLARYLADGSIDYLGRIDSQVKIRGFRIELGEIENALSAHRQIKEAVVLAKETTSGDKRLVAYIVGEGANNDGAEKRNITTELIEELRQHLSQSLPDYMVPAAFVLLDKLPLTTNGKVDRKALPEPDMAPLQVQYVAPRSSTELRLQRLWQTVLHLDKISVTDNFFALGGHSLSAVRLMASIETEFGIRLPIAELFTSTTIAKLAVPISSQGYVDRLAVPMQPKGALPPLFLIHPGGGEIFCYSELVASLGDKHAVYAIQDANAAGIRIEPYDMDTIAARYAEEIMSVQPEGSYTLAGWSLGGMYAFKIASILEQRGCHVKWIMLLDSIFPSAENHQSLPLTEFIKNTLAGSQEELRLRYSAEDFALHHRIESLINEIGIERFSNLLVNEPDFLETELDFEKSIQTLMLQNYRTSEIEHQLLVNFSPKAISSPVHRVWAEGTVQKGRDITAWDAFILDQNNSRQYVFPGVHKNFVEGESMPKIAKLLTELLEESTPSYRNELEKTSC